MECGVPQCYILGLAYFTMNIADMPTMVDSDSELFSDDKSIKFVDSTKCLGLTIDSRLNWKKHIQKCSQAFGSKIGWSPFNQDPPNRLSTRSLSFNPSIYGIKEWGSCNKNLLQDIESLHIKARFVKRINKRT